MASKFYALSFLTSVVIWLTIHAPFAFSLDIRNPIPSLASRQAHVNTTGSVYAPPRLRNATAADIEKARAIVNSALSEAAARNKARLANPSRNKYNLKPGTATGEAAVKRSGVETLDSDPPPLLDITQEIADAAALLAEADAYAKVNGSAPSPTLRKRAGFWMEDISRKGSWPFKNDGGYQVFRNVKDFGAVGDGVTDDTAAIKSAINSTRSRRCAEGCNGSTLHNAVVYFPSGTYLVSSSIYALFGTQMIGNPNDPPVIKGAPSFVGLGVFSTDEYVPNGGTGPDGNAKEWYINTANFYRQIRNFKFDITQTNPYAYICAIHYQVAQATSLSNVEFNVAPPPTTQQAIFAENGSGGVMSDLVFNGGNFGIYGGSQQFTAQRLTFKNCETAVQLIWDWGWTWKSIDISGCTTGFKLISEDGTHHTGSMLLMDSKFTNTGTAILTFPATKELARGTTGITLDNVAFASVKNAVVDTEGKSYLAASVGSVDTWVLGPIYSDGRVRGDSLSMSYVTPREKSLLGSSVSGLPKAPFFERARPQYGGEGAGSFVHMKDYAKGDGSTDDTAGFQKALDDNAGSKIIFVDAGSYILTDTVTIPAGTRIVGEAWSQLVASGNKFGDASNPRPLIRVGKKGDVGSVEIQDLLFTSKGATPGAVFVEWNIKASSPGAAAMWDSHVRLGGAEGTKLTSKECPPSTSGTNSGCNVGSLMMHLKEGASALLDNVWLWLADHDIDDPNWADDNNNMVQMSAYVARGLLVESTDATWLYGTSSEHAVMYQYNFWKAKNVFAGMIQTESPYYQPTPKPPAPFAGTVGQFPGDWRYDCQSSGASGCDASWALLIRNSTEIFIAGAGLYSWFTTYTQDCVDTMNCQKSLALIANNFEHVRIHNLITIGATNMIESDGYQIKSADNLAVDFHPYWSQISVFDPIQNEPDRCRDRLTEPGSDDPQQDGHYPPALPVGTNLPALPTKNYLTIVNGTPYRFRLTSTHTNQMKDWEWHDIPAGESRQNTFEYRATEYAVDDKGEAYYEIEGTGKTFVVLVRTDYANNGEHFLVKMDYRGLSTRDAGQGTIFPIYTSGGGHGIEWVLTGSEDYGYWSSYSPPEDWMHSILDVIGERKLKHVCMPGSHDAGIYQIGSTAGGASAGNCQTQDLTILEQMRRGSRYFDIRPVLGDGGKYLMGHYSTDSIKAGCNGGSLEDLVSDTNKFLATNAELVILYLSHGYDTDNGYTDFTDKQWDGALAILEKIDKKCANVAKDDLTEATMNEYIGKGGCALIVTDGGTERASKGIYRSSRFPRKDDFSDSNDPPYMADDQIAKLQRHRNIRDPASDANADTFFVLSWTLTSKGGDLIFQTIRAYARLAHDTLAWKAFSAFTPFSFPNVLYVDYFGGVRATDYDSAKSDLAAMAMAVNLQIASQNCYVGGGKMGP